HAFTYKQNLEMDEQSRVENPLGFWVTSYRVDDDYATAPPPEATLPPLMMQPSPTMVATPATGTTPTAAVAADPLPGAGSR
ncbi:VirB8/TrbF family protein, partial [Rhodanobacter lindaniclasticus]